MLSAYSINSLLIIVGFLIILGIVGLLAYLMVKKSHRIASSTFDRHIAEAMRPKIEHPEPTIDTLTVPSSITTIPVRHHQGHRLTGQNRLNRAPIPSPIAIPQPPPKTRIWQKPRMDNHVHVPPPPMITLTNASLATREI